MSKSEYPTTRMRRLRHTENLRKMFDMPFSGPEKFIWPTFVTTGKNIKEEIPAMPGQFTFSPDMLNEEVKKLIDSGINSILIFGIPEEDKKDATGTPALQQEDPVYKAVSILRMNYPELTVFTDVCMCAYTDHGHCGVLDKSGNLDNDESLKHLSDIALHHAEAGATGVAPSAMADGQVKAIREKLDQNGFSDTLLMSYSTKFASSFYGPFREVENSSPTGGSRAAYQQSAADPKQAIRESLIDEKEGADILMIKPALSYLDVISAVSRETHLPLAAYNVSGEYSMLHATAEKGWGDLYRMARETLLSMNRAGADILISYWANQYERLIEK
ncbi:MAG: porphobilinogen synthase [Planctomycetota bacterium]|jgi:porphobilinogen synthase